MAGIISLSNYLITIGAAVGLFYYVVSRQRALIATSTFARENNCLPIKQCPQFDRILGLDMLLAFRREAKRSNIMRFLTDLLTIHGSTCSISLMGSAVIFTVAPENVKAVLATNFEDFGIEHRKPVFGPLLENGIFMSDGAEWHRARALVRPAFTKSQVAGLDMFESHLGRILEKIPRDGSTADLAPIFQKLTADTGFEFLLGDSITDLTPQEKSSRQEVLAAFDYVGGQFGKYKNKGWLRHLFYFNKFARSCRLIHAYFDAYVQQVLQRSDPQVEEKAAPLNSQDNLSKRYVFLEELVKSTRDPLRIRGELMSVLFASRETTANLLTNAFHVLAHHPDVWKKLKVEVDDLGGNLPDYDVIRDMKYLRHFLNECLRIYPVVPANDRIALRTTVLPSGGGPDGKSPIVIQKGQVVFYMAYAMHRDRAAFGDNVEEFRPERWEDIRPGWHYLPFNGGPRICPGQQFALTEASYTIVRFLQTFNKIENRDPEPFVEKVTVSLTSKNGAKMALFE